MVIKGTPAEIKAQLRALIEKHGDIKVIKL